MATNRERDVFDEFEKEFERMLVEYRNLQEEKDKLKKKNGEDILLMP